MKSRVSSAIIALCIFVPILFYGGLPYGLFIFLLSLQGIKEFIQAYSNKKEVPQFIQFISYIVISFLVLSCTKWQNLTLTVDLRILTAIVLVYLTPIVIYQNEKTYSIIDALCFIGGISLLGVGFMLLNIIRNIRLEYMIYLFLITTMTDTFAFVTGKLIGKHRCTPTISPNKTWEGVIGGTVLGTFISFAFFETVIETSMPLYFSLGMTILLSIIGQIGDLVFSAMKRNFKIKDFSNFMPGHGGILDRFDSIFFVTLAFTFFTHLI